MRNRATEALRQAQVTWRTQGITRAGSRSVAPVLFARNSRLPRGTLDLLIHDNSGFDSVQLKVLRTLLGSLPMPFRVVRNIMQNALLNNHLHTANAAMCGRGVNIFEGKVGDYSENSFPEDSGYGIPVDGFTIVSAHETSHIIDRIIVERDPQLLATRQRLIGQAGTVDLNYLRSFSGGGVFFQESPQEFFASLGNQWFSDSFEMIKLGVARYNRGYREPINQALFLFEVFSLGSNKSQLYKSNSSGEISTDSAVLKRDAAGRITDVSYGDAGYHFDLDQLGNVIGYHQQLSFH